MLESLSEHELLVFWAELLVLVVFARALGVFMRRIGLPSVIGELGAGLILGPSVFGRVWPDGFDWLFPGGEAQSAALLAVSWLGVALLLIVTGFETDLALIRKLGLPAASGLVTILASMVESASATRSLPATSILKVIPACTRPV